MSIENITADIINDAKNIAEDSLANAEKTKQEMINNAKYEVEAIIRAAAQKAAKDAEDLINRKISAAELQKRKMMLDAKQQAIKRSFDATLVKLTTMQSEEYLNYLIQEIVKIPNCEGNIVLNAKDRENFGEKLVKAVNEKLGAVKVALSDNTVQTSGGFVLKRGNVEINNTFEALLDSMKDKLTSEIANALFK